MPPVRGLAMPLGLEALAQGEIEAVLVAILATDIDIGADQSIEAKQLPARTQT